MMRRLALAAVHLSLLLAVAAAVVSALTRNVGTVYVGCGETADIFIMPDRSTCVFPASVRLDSVRPPVMYLTVAGRKYTVSPNHPARLGGYTLYFVDSSETEVLVGVTYDPWGFGLALLAYILYAAGAFALLLTRSKWRVVAAVTATAAIALGFVIRHFEIYGTLPAILQSPWLPVHVVFTAVSYALLIGAAITKRPLSWLVPGVLLLGMGICSGSVWAESAWGKYWSWDPKEAWALVVFAVYCLPLHCRYVRPLQSRRAMRFYLCGAVAAASAGWWLANNMESLHAYLD